MTPTQAHVFGELQIRMSLAQILEKQRSVAVETAVREQFESDLRDLTDAEQDSKELKSAKRSLLYDRIIETVELPFPVGRRGRRAVKDSLTKSYVKKACDAIYKSLVRQKIAVDKRRPDGRSRDGDPPDRGRGVGHAAHARLGPLHPRADADHDAADARHGEGRPADRRPLARDGSPLHAPLQLPALLGG